MRESNRPIEEMAAVTGAIVRLAAATRDHTIDDKVIGVYMPHLDGYTADEVILACGTLEAEVEYFPKVKELLWACSKARRKFQDEAAEQRASTAPRYLNAPPNPERHAELMAKIRQTCRIHKMPNIEAPDEQA